MRILLPVVCFLLACGDSALSGAADAACPAATKSPDLTGTWIWHREVTQCGSSPADTTIVLQQTGAAVSVTAGSETLTATTSCGTLTIGGVSGGSGGPGIIAGLCHFTGTIDPSGNSIAGGFNCECVAGTWTATRTP